MAIEKDSDLFHTAQSSDGVSKEQANGGDGDTDTGSPTNEEQNLSTIEDGEVTEPLTQTQHSATRLAEEEAASSQQTRRIQRPGGTFRVFPVRPADNELTADEQEKVEKRLPEDTFSFVMISRTRSWPFWFGTMISVFQLAIYVVVLMDQINPDDKNNKCGFPANVSPAVRAAEAIALIILVPLQDEILDAMMLINDGYDVDALERKFPETSRRKFWYSMGLRLTVGMLSVTSSFLLIMSSDNVLDIFFNFIALQFINELDTLGFRLASDGLLGSSIQAGAEEVSDTSYFTDKSFRRQFPLVFIFLALLGGWLWVFYLQETGRFVSSSIEVQFGDDLVPILATFSGIYDREKRPSRASDGRFRYVGRESGVAYFAYCPKLEAWTFTWTSGDPCDFRVRSSKTETYEITEADLWEVGAPQISTVPLDPFYMACFKCANGESPCRNHGEYKNGECHCKPQKQVPTFGRRCGFIGEPCQRIVLNTESEDYQGPEDVPTDYDVVKDDFDNYVTLFGKPVYANAAAGGVIIFNGRRWHITTTENLDINGGENLNTIIEHAFQTLQRPSNSSFISDASDIGTLSDNIAPIRSSWYRASTLSGGEKVQRPLLDQDAGVDFNCGVCSLVYECQLDYPCINGTCDCQDGTSGPVCEHLPLSNGHCNTRFNTWDYNFDGGDCCRGTCTSTSEYSCGYDGRIEVGFMECADHAFTCQSPQTSCWALRATQHQLERAIGTPSGNSTVVQLSPNGRVLAIGYPHLSRVQLFDQVDSMWVQRGDDISGPRGRNFGSSITISSAHGSIIDFVSVPVDVRIAVGGVYVCGENHTFTVQVLDWDLDSFVPVGQDIEIIFRDSFLKGSKSAHFDLFGDGRYLAMQVESAEISIFDLEEGSKVVATVTCESLGIVCEMGSFLSVSERGTFLLKSSSSSLHHVVGSSQDFATATWSAKEVSANAGWSSLSKNGQVIAMASPATSVFQFFAMQNNNDWARLGEDIAIKNNWEFIDGVAALSVDGLTATFGFSQQNGQTSQVEVYRFAETSGWSQLGNAIPSDSAPAVSSSYDSSSLAVADASGELRTFYHSPHCSSGQSYFRIFLVVEAEQDVDWSLRQLSGGSVLEEVLSPKYNPLNENRKVLQEVCLPQGQCTVFDISTFSASGQTGFPGSVLSVMVDNKEVVHSVVVNASHTLHPCQG